MKTPEHQILVCASFRLSGTPQGICQKRESTDLLQYLEEEIIDRGLDALVCTTGCLKACEKGPVMVVQPANAWYGEVDTDCIDRVLDGLEEGELPAEQRLS
ncbi:MAG: (2Fe-2S) ferredoxin domain-containing protein [Planctomycetota bacterium]|nr:MAG: (2Fe-2S) ferredoxin domain-containing protein [Planctomycetota bacterium]